MKTELAVSVLVVGLVTGGFAAYLLATSKQRSIKRVREEIEILGAYHDLPQRDFQRTVYPASFASDEYVLAALQAARTVGAKVKADRCWRDEELAAETILCENFLGLGARDALALLREADGDFERLPEILRGYRRDLQKVNSDAI